MNRVVAGLAVMACMAPATARAGEVWAGAYAHDVKTPLTYSGFEPGVDLQLGWRGEPLQGWRGVGGPSPYVFVSANTRGATNFAAAGLSWRFGERVYFRPGLGLAIHDGPDRFDETGERIYFGSRVVFEPEVAVGWRVSDRLSVDASWVHLSHAQLLSRQNPGMDAFGVRVNYRMGGR